MLHTAHYDSQEYMANLACQWINIQNNETIKTLLVFTCYRFILWARFHLFFSFLAIAYKTPIKRVSFSGIHVTNKYR